MSATQTAHKMCETWHEMTRLSYLYWPRIESFNSLKSGDTVCCMPNRHVTSWGDLRVPHKPRTSRLCVSLKLCWLWILKFSCWWARITADMVKIFSSLSTDYRVVLIQFYSYSGNASLLIKYRWLSMQHFTDIATKWVTREHELFEPVRTQYTSISNQTSKLSKA